MKLSRPLVINSTLAAVIVAAAVGVYFVANPITTASATATQLTGTVQQGVVSSTITASGSIAAVGQVSAAFEVSGTIASVNVALGQTVTAGDTLGTVNSDDLVEARTDAYNDLADAQEELSDAEDAVASADATQDSSSAESAVSSAEDKVETATDAVTEAEAAVAATTLTAPISGMVVAINNAVGDTTSASSSSSAATGTDTATTTSSGFVTIADVSAYTVTANIAEADIAAVAVGQAATVIFPALEDVTAAATVTAVSPTATATNSVVTYATTITLSEIPEGLRLGQTAEAAITTVASAEDALYVPSAAITAATDGTSTVDVIDDEETTSTVTVELGVVGDEGTEILSGLEAGQTVVLGEVAATDEAATESTERGGMESGTFPGGGTMPSGGFPGGTQ
ncbi:MAG TPA: efflux RND transporter periplasmic adaptor subunit [Glaciihabitans sp.]|nr:efflux RND transporter periplasmic adaptor subunit [Glaciihabitans sp.]